LIASGVAVAIGNQCLYGNWRSNKTKQMKFVFTLYNFDDFSNQIHTHKHTQTAHKSVGPNIPTYMYNIHMLEERFPFFETNTIMCKRVFQMDYMNKRFIHVR